MKTENLSENLIHNHNQDIGFGPIQFNMVAVMDGRLSCQDNVKWGSYAS